MKLEALISFFASNPSAKLLRSQYAAYVVFFLYRHFKEEGHLATAHSELLQQLNRYLDHLRQTAPDVLRDRAEVYLTQWSTGDTRWLNRYYDRQHAESVYQLTPHTEDVLKFLTAVLDKTLGFVGTESRLKRIIDTLNEIVVGGNDDPTIRLHHLRAERSRIDQEIRAIESGESVTTLSPTAIRERFSDAVSDLNSLQGDFRAVEESFKNITRQVQRQQAESAATRGNILAFALDAEDQLKEQDQGISFDQFVRLILSQTKQDELEGLINRLDEITELAEQVEGMQRIKSMIGSLSAEAEKVLWTTRRLSATLRRLLDSRASASRLRLAGVLRDIQTAAVRLADDHPEEGVEVYTELELSNISQRTFWESPIHFDELELSHDTPDEDERLLAFRAFAEMRRLDWELMRSNIARLVHDEEQTTLPALLASHPPTSGPIEVLAYVQLAHDDGHEVDCDEVDVVYLTDPAAGDDLPPQPYEIPRVTYLSDRMKAFRVQFNGGATQR